MSVSSPRVILILFTTIIATMTTTSTSTPNDSVANETLLASNTTTISAAQDKPSTTKSTRFVTSTETMTASTTTTTTTTTTATTTTRKITRRSRIETMLSFMRSMDVFQMAKRFLAQEDIRISFTKPEKVNQRCYDEVIDFVDALIGERQNASSRKYVTTPWALQMADAFGKPPAGLLRGIFQWVGNYDACLDVQAKIPKGTYLGSRKTARSMTSEFRTRYCRAVFLNPTPGLPIHEFVDYSIPENKTYFTNWGMCVPESCGRMDLKRLLTEEILATLKLPVYDVVCFERDRDLGSDGWAVFAVCLLSFVGAVVLISTVMESAIYYGFLPLSEVPKENGIMRNGLPKGTNTHHDDKDSEKNGMKAGTSNDKTPLSMDNRPKDLFRDEEISSTKSSNTQRADRKDRKSTVVIRLLEAFSIRCNGSKIMATSTSSDPSMLTCIQGIRVISIGWIVLGHTYSTVFPNPFNLMTSSADSMRKTISRLSFTFVTGANFSVDTFFVISGILVMKITLRELRRGQGQTVGFWVKFYLHRIWRLTPVYMMVLMTGTTLYDYLVDGPLKSKPSLLFHFCETNWWSNLLYINNFYKLKELCMPWSWYLAIDMQLFVISPIFVLLLHRKYRAGLLFLVATIILGTLTSFLITLDNPGILATAVTNWNEDYIKHVYLVPWGRIAVFTIGMLLGVVLEDAPSKPYFSKLKAAFIWIFLTCAAVFIIMIAHDEMDNINEHWPKGTMALYESMSRLVWSIYIAWIIYACQTGLGGIANDFFTWRGFLPLARLTYTVYLVHPMIITLYVNERNFPFDIHQDIIMIYMFCGNLVLSYLVAALFTLLFESPLLTLERIFLKSNEDTNR